MKNLKISIMLLLIVGIFTSCEKETTALPENAEVNVSFEEITSFEKQVIQNQIIENFKSKRANTSARDEITYEGQLCGDNIIGGYANETDYQNLHIYYFTGNAGDVISIYVPRTTIGFDSYFNLHHESDDGNNIVDEWRDDTIDDTFGGCWADPYLGNYTLPYSGLYTLTVMRAASCGFPYGYEIITTGINCNDRDGDGVLNEDDPYPNSNMRESLLIGENSLDIENVFTAEGTTMMDQIDELIAEINEQYDGENYDELHRDFTRGIAKITYFWRKDRLISRSERSDISSAAWSANIPYFNERD